MEKNIRPALCLVFLGLYAVVTSVSAAADPNSKSAASAAIYASFEASKACFSLSNFYESVVSARKRGISLESINANLPADFSAQNQALINKAFMDKSEGRKGADKFFYECAAEKKAEISKMLDL